MLFKANTLGVSRRLLVASFIDQQQSRRLISKLSTSIRPRQQSGRRVYLLGFAATTLLGAIIYSQGAKASPLNPSKFTTTKLISSKACDDTNYKLIELELPETSIPTPYPGAIWATYIKDDDIQIERPFTPLQSVNGSRRLRYWIKRYEDGEMSRWICAQPVNKTIEIRGPMQTMDWTRERDKWDHVLMVLFHNRFCFYFPLTKPRYQVAQE